MTLESVVTVIDYGAGNLLSVSRALEYCGAKVELTCDPHCIANASHLLLPGVGAFADGMAGLNRRDLISPIRDFLLKKRPFLGICLGMQMMFDESDEFGPSKGLGIIPGRVSLIPNTSIDGKPHKIPHIGWNGLIPTHGAPSWNGTIMNNFLPGNEVYFVHSYVAQPTNDAHRIAHSLYNGRSITSVVQSQNAFGCQFHPEKSGKAGLELLKNFCRFSSN